MNTENELLSIVDENDIVIGTELRGKIHAAGSLHRAVHILAFNDHKQLFLQKRSFTKDINPGLWDSSAAGHVDAGESYECCAKREFLFKLPASIKIGMEFIQVYRCSHNGPFTLAADEIDEGRWFSVNEISKRVRERDALLTLSFRLIWSRFSESS